MNKTFICEKLSEFDTNDIKGLPEFTPTRRRRFWRIRRFLNKLKGGINGK